MNSNMNSFFYFKYSIINMVIYMIKKKLLIDIDDVVCDSGFLYLMNKFLNTNYKIDDFTEYYIDDVIGDDKAKQKFYKYYINKNSYDHAKLYPNAYKVIKKLNEKYDIYICTACINPFFIDRSSSIFVNKYNWLLKTLPFLDPNKFIFTNAKNIVKADIQIDDRLTNLQGDIKQKYLFTSYHNKNISDAELKSLNIIRVNNWKEIERELLNIV